MPNDLHGRPLALNDTVIIKGTVFSMAEDLNYLNCVVQLAEPLPPTGADHKISVNSKQIEKDVPVAVPRSKQAKAAEPTIHAVKSR